MKLRGSSISTGPPILHLSLANYLEFRRRDMPSLFPLDSLSKLKLIPLTSGQEQDPEQH